MKKHHMAAACAGLAALMIFLLLFTAVNHVQFEWYDCVRTEDGTRYIAGHPWLEIHRTDGSVSYLMVRETYRLVLSEDRRQAAVIKNEDVVYRIQEQAPQLGRDDAFPGNFSEKREVRNAGGKYRIFSGNGALLAEMSDWNVVSLWITLIGGMVWMISMFSLMIVSRRRAV